jgi:hypothetical protein
MTAREVYDVWAPAGGSWSDWVKPVLFAHINKTWMQPLPPQTFDVSWAPPADGQAAMVVDLPGGAGVWFAVALAERGYRPVPLYNAVPGPAAVVEVQSIIAALEVTTRTLVGLNLPWGAPPAFLLDANRRMGHRAAAPGMLDNRSVSFVTDFPSSNLLMSRGIHRAMLVQHDAVEPQPDLAHTLRRWQEAGIELQSMALSGPAPVPCVVAKPAWYRSLFYRLIWSFGLRRSPLGGFGGVLPVPSSG